MAVASKGEMASRKRILIADDDEQLQRVARRALEAAGFEISQASSGTELMQQLDGELPDLILLDVGLPDSDGRDILSRLKGATRTSHVPIAVWSGRNPDSDRRIALDLGAVDYLEKGGPMSLLPGRIRRLMLRLEG